MGRPKGTALQFRFEGLETFQPGNSVEVSTASAAPVLNSVPVRPAGEFGPKEIRLPRTVHCPRRKRRTEGLSKDSGSR